MNLTLDTDSPGAQRARSVRALVIEEIKKGQDQATGPTKNQELSPQDLQWIGDLVPTPTSFDARPTSHISGSDP